MTKDDRAKTGGPAFPLNAKNSLGTIIETGATLRDFFAAHVLANPAIAAKDERVDKIAGAAYAIADAMIAARKTEGV